MTRPLHADTRVQRSDEPGSVSPEAHRARGYEPRDARISFVIAGVAAFLALMVLGLTFAGLTVGWLQDRSVPDRGPFPAAGLPLPSPRLLVDPPAARQRLEQASKSALDDEAVEQAEETVLTQGWGKDSAPRPDAVARKHREALP